VEGCSKSHFKRILAIYYIKIMLKNNRKRSERRKIEKLRKPGAPPPLGSARNVEENANKLTFTHWKSLWFLANMLCELKSA